MCQPQTELPAGEQWFLDHPQMRAFIEHVNQARRQHMTPQSILVAIRSDFEALLADLSWLPAEFRHPSAESGMGGGIGMWLLYRSGDGGLAFSSLVVPAGSETPVHNHLTWGLVGLYRGTQQETVYRRMDDRTEENKAVLAIQEQIDLQPGDCYELLPRNDIHSVRTTSDDTSVSLHLLGNDNGCTWRHQFDPVQQKVTDFRSGWLNAACREY